MSLSVQECHDIVSHPGKFEGQPAYVPYYWEIYLNGCADDDGYRLTFHVMPEDVMLFPELKDVTDVYLIEDDNGFVYHGIVR